MAINIKKELDRWNENRAAKLLDVIQDQPAKQVTAEKLAILKLATHDDRVYEWIRQRGMVNTFVDMIHAPDVNTQVAACRFYKGCCLYEGFEAAVRAKLMRLLELVGDDRNRSEIEQWEAASAVCYIARNEALHKDILESAYSLIDMFRSRDWVAERTAATLSAYAFTNPYLVEEAVGVTARTDVMQRVSDALNKSHDFITRRMSLKALMGVGQGRSIMTNDDVISLRNNLRSVAASLDFAVYFTTTFAYAFLRHYQHWGIKGQLKPVIAASAVAGAVSGAFALYTGEWLNYKIEELKYKYFLQSESEKRKENLRRMNRSMSRLPGGKAIDIGSEIPDRYRTLQEITSEVSERAYMHYQTGIIALLVVGFPMPWYLVVPKVLSTYQQVRLGPAFHRIFPALSLKFTRRPRAIVPYVLVPTAVNKALDYFYPNYVSTLRLSMF
eukprot:TRINITY_DN44228_c0_g1_i1.p1 TRINITY_DN44228_c0_g1~~TRINITY_DN44228_c0_g1_i1.p1  ORF type:complete len:442 (+),score=98.44 TRINITY_DN44228_c0_g1_i1:41-1366(+)